MPKKILGEKMEVIMFNFWLLIILFTIIVAFVRKNAVFLLVAGLLTVGFGNVLTFSGLRVVNGIVAATGQFTYITLLPINDQLLAIIAITTLPLGIALSLFALVVLFSEMAAQYRLFVNV